MYNEDKRKLLVMLQKKGLRQASVELSTVDGFQGKQKKIILVHFVAGFKWRGDDGTTVIGHSFGRVANADRLNGGKSARRSSSSWSAISPGEGNSTERPAHTGQLHGRSPG